MEEFVRVAEVAELAARLTTRKSQLTEMINKGVQDLAAVQGGMSALQLVLDMERTELEEEVTDEDVNNAVKWLEDNEYRLDNDAEYEVETSDEPGEFGDDYVEYSEEVNPNGE